MLKDTAILVVEDKDDRFELIKRNLLVTHVDSDIIQLKTEQDILNFLFKTNTEACFEDKKRYILLLDISVPHVNGIEVLKKIKQDLRTKKIPVIILTGNDDPHAVEQCYNLGCSTYIVKPNESHEFEDFIQKIGCFLSGIETTLIQ
jgi:CheY-like chemotaxis protein